VGPKNRIERVTSGKKEVKMGDSSSLERKGEKEKGRDSLRGRVADLQSKPSLDREGRVVERVRGEEEEGKRREETLIARSRKVGKGRGERVDVQGKRGGGSQNQTEGKPRKRQACRAEAHPPNKKRIRTKTVRPGPRAGHRLKGTEA